MLYDDNTAGQTYELYGPKEYSTAAIAKLVDREIYKKRWHINLPKAILRPLAAVLNRVLYWPVLSAEDVDREFIDQQIDESAKTFADLGITPGDLKDYTYHYLVRDTHPVLRAARWMLTIFSHSSDTVAMLTTTSLLQRRRKRSRRESMFMCWTTNKGHIYIPSLENRVQEGLENAHLSIPYGMV